MHTSVAQTTRADGSTRVRALVHRHALALYFALAFGISWGAVALMGGPLRPEGAGLMLGLFLAQAAGPSAASLVLTGVVDGRAGYRDLLVRLGRWRVAPRWYAALLINPLTLLVVLAGLSLTSAAYIPGIVTNDHPLARGMGITSANPLAIVALALAVGLASGLFEEIGWTGFATPRLLARHACLAAGLGLGVLWATWHIGPDAAVSVAGWGNLWPWRVLLWMYAGMVPYRVLMTWVYRHTSSVLLAILMHATYSGGQVLLEPGTTTLSQELVWWGALGLALAGVVAVVALVDRPHMLTHIAGRDG